MLILAVCLASTAGTAAAGWPMGLAGAYARRFIGPQIRMASPYAYGTLLAANRAVPPQVKNGVNRGGFGPYRGGYNPYAAELNYWRSMPPQVRNNIVRQQQMGYQAQPQPPNGPVPTTSASRPTGARPSTVYPETSAAGYSAPTVIPAPPPPAELPNIIRR